MRFNKISASVCSFSFLGLVTSNPLRSGGGEAGFPGSHDRPDPPVQSVKLSASGVSNNPVPSAVTSDPFINTILQKHNDLRAKHGASALTWDGTLAAAALKQASTCSGEHTADNLYGENIYSFSSSGDLDFKDRASTAIQMWYDEISEYNAASPLNALHFTQVVWKGSSKLGCAWNADRCSNSMNWHFYCEYDPRGNVMGSFPANV